jgi:WD40 repeat protein
VKILSLLSLLISALSITVSALPAVAAAPVTAAAMAPGSQQVVLGSVRGIEVRSWPGLEPIATLRTALAHVHDLSFSPDGMILLAAGGAPAEHGSVELWSWPSHELIRGQTLHADVVYRVAWSPDGQHFASAGGDAICRIVDANSGRERVRYAGHSRSVLSLRYLPDGQRILSAGVDQTLRLWDSADGRHLRTLDNHVGSINDIAVRPGSVPDPDRVIVATIAQDSTVRFWQPEIGRLIRFARLASVPRSMAWTPSGERLLVACDDGRIHVIDPDSAAVEASHQAAQDRIYELVIDMPGDRWLIAGQSGAQIIRLEADAVQ